MGNNLLDFVMALVRDENAAARYAADPAQAIADAGLAGVSPADVAALLPMTGELIPAAPSTRSDAGAAEPGHNVWASASAVAAFDFPFAAPRHDPSLDAGLHASLQENHDEGAVAELSEPSEPSAPSAIGSAAAAVEQFAAPLDGAWHTGEHAPTSDAVYPGAGDNPHVQPHVEQHVEFADFSFESHEGSFGELFDGRHVQHDPGAGPAPC